MKMKWRLSRNLPNNKEGHLEYQVVIINERAFV
jgi:hypothetical protein